MATWSDRAPLSARQLDALRHLEAWASRNDEAPAPSQQQHYTMGPAGALIAHPEADTPSTVEVVDSMGALESFALRAEALMQERRHAPDQAQLRQLDAQRECAAALEAHCDSMRAQLDGKATECAALRSASSDLLERFGKRVEAHREEQALQAALRQQLAPLEEARAVSVTLERHAWRDDAPHSPSHPLVSALEQLDKAAKHLREHSYWTNSATHLAQVLATRARALSMVATLITRPIDSLTAAAALRLAAPPPAQQKPAPAATAAQGGGEATATAGEAEVGGGEAGGGEAGGGEAGGAVVDESEARARREAVEGEVLYLRYRALAALLAPWIAEVSKRQDGSEEASAVMRDVSGAYWRARRTVASSALRAALTHLVESEPEAGGLSAVVRSGCAHTKRTCRAEHSLALAFFPPESGTTSVAATSSSAGATSISATAGESHAPSSPEMSMHVASVCAPLYDELRPLLLSQQGLPELCEVVLILRTEVMPEILSGGPPVAPLEKLIHRLLQDTQERITFRVQTFVRDEIRNFKPEDPDIDYPRVRAQPQPAGVGEAAVADEAAAASDSTMVTWYETVSRALSCLAQLYRCVPRAVFEGLAQEILTECTDSIGRAASRIASRKRSSLDGTLFTVSQLLTLREQIAPFDSDFAITHKQLDFTQTREAVRSLVERRGRLGGIGGALELLQSGAPLLVQSQHDAKAALDAQLRTACEAFIQHATNAAAKPLTDVLEMPNASFVPSASAEEVPSKLDMKVVAAAVEKAEAGVHGELANAHQLMTAYLPEAQTHEILFAPVRTNVLDALGQLETLIHAAGLTAAERVGCETERLTKLSAAVDGMGAASRGHAAHGRDRAT